MLRKLPVVSISLTFAVSLAAAPNTSSPRALSASEIAEKNVAARGGLQAWRAVETLSLTGKMGAGGNQRATLSTPNPNQKEKLDDRFLPHRRAEEAQLPFVMELKRPHKMRFELQFKGQTAVQVYDGTNGWKVRPFLNRSEVEPYSADELKIASMQQDLDPPLVDYAAKGTRVELAGTEKVEGQDNYKLKLTLRNGQAMHVWIDAKTFLETKMEGTPRRLDGTDHPVEVYFRDFRPEGGVEMPHVLETKVLPVVKNSLGLKDPPVPVERITIEKVQVNPKLADTLFTKPELTVASKSK